MENNNEVVPEDIQNEILLRLPVKSLGKCICVSKKWAALILDKYFRDRYFLHSITRPRLLFVFVRRDNPNVLLFHSVYQEKEPLLSSGLQQTLVNLEPESKVCAVLRGLVCIKSDIKIMIYNPGTKKFLTLPELRERDVIFTAAFLGYDEATNVFKVLCLTNKRVCNNRLEYKDHRLFIVGSGKNRWRKTVYKPRHCPVTGGLCKDGVLYYGAWTIRGMHPILMSFNLRSEELNIIELPNSVPLNGIGTSLVNYNGEIALANSWVDEFGEIKIWVRNEVKGDWREEHLVIPLWRPFWIETVGDRYKAFCFKGTIGTGELVFALEQYNIEGSMCVLYYDKFTQHLRKFEIEGFSRDTFHHASTFLDHVDSLSLL